VLDGIGGKVQELGVTRVVVGHPVNLRGSEGQAAKMAVAFAVALRERLEGQAEVVLVDERSTSVQAHGLLRQAGRAGRRHREVVDQVAASLILQQALDMRRSIPPPDEAKELA
jgi:putative Holliday junction resolvase